MKTFAVLLGVMACVQALELNPSGIGALVGQLNKGLCKAFLDDPNDTTSDCYKSCDDTSTTITSFFSGYTSWNAITTTDIFNQVSVSSIKFLTQNADCKQTEFIQQLDNRFSDIAFLSGTGSNLVVQLVMFAMNGFTPSDKGTSLGKLINNFSKFNFDDATDMGYYLTMFVAQLMNFKTPGIASQLSTY